jgi:hypothetical protein
LHTVPTRWFGARLGVCISQTRVGREKCAPLPAAAPKSVSPSPPGRLDAHQAGRFQSRGRDLSQVRRGGKMARAGQATTRRVRAIVWDVRASVHSTSHWYSAAVPELSGLATPVHLRTRSFSHRPQSRAAAAQLGVILSVTFRTTESFLPGACQPHATGARAGRWRMDARSRLDKQRHIDACRVCLQACWTPRWWSTWWWSTLRLVCGVSRGRHGARRRRLSLGRDTATSRRIGTPRPGMQTQESAPARHLWSWTHEKR